MSAAERGRRRGWRSPLWKDPAWWYAVFCTAVVSGLVWLVFFRKASSGFRWVGLAFVVIVLWAVFSGLIRIYVGVVRAHAEGKAEGERRAEERLRAREAAKASRRRAEPSPAATTETPARDARDTRDPTDTTTTNTTTTNTTNTSSSSVSGSTGAGQDKLDQAARSAGRFLGRAVAAGKKAAETYRDDPPRPS